MISEVVNMNDKEFIDSIPQERRLEIDAMLKETEKQIEELGFEGMMKNSMTFEEFKKYNNEKIRELREQR